MTGLPAVRGAATASAPATCGELCQGVLDERDFLVTAPIDRFSRVTALLRDDGEVIVQPHAVDFSKVEEAARRALVELESRAGVTICVDSTVPRGKGLASSSADITAAIHAVARAHGRALAPETISRLAIAIEPSDGVFYGGAVIYDHVRGTLFERLGDPPPLGFIVVDEGGELDTVHEFDRDRARANARRFPAELRSAIDCIRRGFAVGDPALVARGATLSARCHQHVLPKPDLERLIEGTAGHGGLGVNCAHSGTVLGVMFDPTRTDASRIAARVAELVGSDKIFGQVRLVSGGVR